MLNKNLSFSIKITIWGTSVCILSCKYALIMHGHVRKYFDYKKTPHHYFENLELKFYSQHYDCGTSGTRLVGKHELYMDTKYILTIRNASSLNLSFTIKFTIVIPLVSKLSCGYA